MNHVEYIADVKKKLLQTAQLMIDEQINLIEGCRIIVTLSNQLDNPNNNVFNCFKAVDSETDHIPIGDVRTHYNQIALKKIDAELIEYLIKTKPAIMKACKNLLKLKELQV